MPRTILIIAPDLMFQSRIAATATSLNFAVTIADSNAQVTAALAPVPPLPGEAAASPREAAPSPREAVASPREPVASPRGATASPRDAVALAIIDLHAAGIDATAAIRAARAAAIPVLAFGRHTDPQTLRAAREAGATTVIPRSQLVEALPSLIQELTDPPPSTPHPQPPSSNIQHPTSNVASNHDAPS